MTICYPDTMTVKRDIQRRIEDYVNQYCRALEENFKQYSIRSYKTNIESPTSATEGYKSYYQEQLEKIEDGTANLYKFDYKVGKKFIKVFHLCYEEANDYYGRKAGYRAGSVTNPEEFHALYSKFSWIIEQTDYKIDIVDCLTALHCAMEDFEMYA